VGTLRVKGERKNQAGYLHSTKKFRKPRGEKKITGMRKQVY